MGRLLWLPDVLRDAGLKVKEVDGWETRGTNSMVPRGIIAHHTAGASTGDIPTLGVLISGRPGLPGPLSQLGLSRETHTYYVVASGKANHAGLGQWDARPLGGDYLDLSTEVIGIEAEHTGRSGVPWPGGQVDAYLRGAAAILNYLGRPAANFCGHKEWAQPPESTPNRKIDPIDVNMADWRRRIGELMERKPSLMFTPIERKHALTQGDGSRQSDIGAVSRLMNRAYGLGLPEDGTWGGAMEAAVERHFPKSHKPREWLSGKDYADLLVAVAARAAGGGGVDAELRAKFNEHKHAEGTTASPRAIDQIGG